MRTLFDVGLTRHAAGPVPLPPPPTHISPLVQADLILEEVELDLSVEDMSTTDSGEPGDTHALPNARKRNPRLGRRKVGHTNRRWPSQRHTVHGLSSGNVDAVLHLLNAICSEAAIEETPPDEVLDKEPPGNGAEPHEEGSVRDELMDDDSELPEAIITR